MSRVIEHLTESAGLRDLYDKVEAGARLSFDDGVRLFRSRALMAVGGMAHRVRERRHGRLTYFARNMHLNPTNVCVVDCEFCGFYRKYRDKEQ
ncbi:MAG: aminofutalosine synthase MqnE, partial [Acidobacteriota bacterium]|nr:aminofutalosine synthase MqnE [Acidobacteriota bacterium]